MFVCYSKTLSYFCPPAGTDDGFPTPDDVEIKHYCHETYFYQNQNVGSTDVTLTPEYIESATGYTTRLQISGASEAGDDVRECHREYDPANRLQLRGAQGQTTVPERVVDTL